MPGFPGHIVTAMVRQYAQAHRAGRRGDVSLGASQPPGIAADLRAHIPGPAVEPGATLPRMSDLAQRYGIDWARWPGRVRRLARGIQLGA